MQLSKGCWSFTLLIYGLAACQQERAANGIPSQKNDFVRVDTNIVQETYGEHATAAAREGPKAVVALLAAWDTAGKDLSAQAGTPYDNARQSLVCWVPGAQCETDEPGYDHVTIVSGYKIDSAIVISDTAHVVVAYDVVGESYGGERPKPKGGQERWDVRLQRVSDKWRVISPESQKAPSISIGTALQVYAKTRSDTLSIQNLGR